MNFLDKVKNEIRPDISVLVEIEIFAKEINKEIKKNKVNAVCVTGGSIAKGTFLKGDFDVDLFVRFDYSYKDKDISMLLGKILRSFNPTTLHGSRDYYQIKHDNLNYEIVPVLDIKDPEKAPNVTDMSFMHVDWVKKNIKKGQEDEIRLTKKFCKVIGVYGAESYIHGFSGHIIDIMVIHYGSFLGLLKASQKWKPKVIIDTEKYYKNSNDTLFNINKSKTSGPLVVVDPILKTRNAASAVSLEKFNLFKKKAKEFIKNPSEISFAEKKIDIDYLKSKHKKNLIILELTTEKGKQDVIGSRILKAFEFIKAELEKKGFMIKKNGWYWDKKLDALVWFVLQDITLPKTKVIEGPPIEMKDACKEFKKKYKKTFEKKARLCTEFEIKKRNIKENLNEITKKIYLSDKLKSSRLVYMYTQSK
ncbi:MAG: nucleotidyltransferase domain-containing protein [Nanoarchaeota archaeon]